MTPIFIYITLQKTLPTIPLFLHLRLPFDRTNDCSHLEHISVSIEMRTSGLGTLNKLPQEIRDEIFRYLLKGTWLLSRRSSHHYRAMMAYETWKPAVRNFRFAIFQVSKDMYNEATSTFYSESVFRGFKGTFRHVTDRMMTIELDFDFDDFFFDEFENGSHDGDFLLERLTGLNYLRNTLLLKMKLFAFELGGLLSTYPFRRLKALVGFRTIILGFSPKLLLDDQAKERTAFEDIALGVGRELVSTLGPGTVSYVNEFTYLEFHPLEHTRANLGAQMGRCRSRWTSYSQGKTE